MGGGGDEGIHDKDGYDACELGVGKESWDCWGYLECSALVCSYCGDVRYIEHCTVHTLAKRHHVLETHPLPPLEWRGDKTEIYLPVKIRLLVVEIPIQALGCDV